MQRLHLPIESYEDDLNIEGLDDIRRACMPEDTDADYGLKQTSASNMGGDDEISGGAEVEDDVEVAGKIKNRCSSFVGPALFMVMESDYELEDRELLESIEKKYSIKFDLPQPLHFPKPLLSITPAEVEEEEDFETLRAIKKRFGAYDNNSLRTGEGIRSSKISACSKVRTLPSDRQDAATTTVDVWDENLDCHQALESSSSLSKARSHFPEAAHYIIDAIKKNRCSQKIIRCKLIEMEAKIMENGELTKRLVALKDFQTLCRKRTSLALSLKKDPRVLLISVKKVNLKRPSVMHYGPEENANVANYRSVLENAPPSFHRNKWSEEEKENLKKGVRQEFQQISNRSSLNTNNSDGLSGDIDSSNNILASSKFETTPYNIKEFLPKFDWNKLAFEYVMGRSGAECRARWLNCEDPSISRDIWSSEEDQTLLDIVGEKGHRNWFDISESLNTNRTPFQCLLRYQRSLNPSKLNREWTEEEDDKLRAAVERFGERDWQSVASAVEHRTGSQCSNRWKKSLHPERKGSFEPDEDKRLKIAVMFFGLKWEKIAQCLPGRIGPQCRDRYLNCLNPELKWDAWSEEEDARLVVALENYKFCWSKIAKEVGNRTDGQCRKRWMKLFPEDVPKLQEAKKRKKTVISSNFVDRQNERPAFSLDTFLPSPMACLAPEPGLVSKRRKRKTSKAAEKVSNKKDVRQAENVKKRARTRKHKDAPVGHRDSTNNDDGIMQHLLDPHETDERISERQEMHIALVDNDNHNLSSQMGSSELRMMDGVGNNFSERDIPEDREVSGLIRKCRVAGSLKNQGQTKDSKPKESPPQKILETSDSDNITLACFLRNRTKRRTHL